MLMALAVLAKTAIILQGTTAYNIVFFMVSQVLSATQAELDCLVSHCYSLAGLVKRRPCSLFV